MLNGLTFQLNDHIIHFCLVKLVLLSIEFLILVLSQ